MKQDEKQRLNRTMQYGNKKGNMGHGKQIGSLNRTMQYGNKTT